MRRAICAFVAVAGLAGGEARAGQAPLFSADSTAYCGGGITASGRPVREGAVAMNSVPLGTRVRAMRSPFGKRTFTVTDRIGWGSDLDFYVSSCARAVAWGRRTVAVRIVPKVKPKVRVSVGRAVPRPAPLLRLPLTKGLTP